METSTASTVDELNSGSRRKKKQLQNRQKKQYIDEDPLCLNFDRPCLHNSKKLSCLKVSANEVARNREYLFKNKTYVSQNVYLSRLILPYEPQRRRPRNDLYSTPKPKTLSVTYFLLVEKKKIRVQVCKKFFMAALNMGRKRLDTLTKTLFNGNVPKENRGGDRKEAAYAPKRRSVMDFVGKFPAQESHYNRMKSKRVYLSCELNISRMHKMYNDSVSEELKVTKGFFRRVFLTKFNIGFRSPASDVCQLCTLLKNKIHSENNPREKQKQITELRVHKLRSNAFYKLLKKDEPNSITFAFDMQQVQPLPKTPIGEAFYSRQISFYALCIVKADSKNPTFYTWTEDQAGRGASEGSALLEFLSSLEIPESIETIRLFCGGCGGQNKNSFIVQTLLFWLTKKSPPHLQQIKLTFPVRGHSFLPCDRVFGRVEKSLRLKPVITSKEEYHQIYSAHGDVMKLGDGKFKLLDVKELDKVYKKVVGIQNLKRIHLKKTRAGSVIQLFENFVFEGPEEWINLLKRGRRCLNTLKTVPLNRSLSAEKKNDVIKLMEKQFGLDWKENNDFKWYRDLIYGNGSDNGEVEESLENDCQCDCLEPDVGLHI